MPWRSTWRPLPWPRSAAQRAVDFLAVRAISDAVDDELPPDIGKLLAQKSFAGQLGAALGSIFRRPAAVKDLFNLHQNALASSGPPGEVSGHADSALSKRADNGQTTVPLFFLLPAGQRRPTVPAAAVLRTCSASICCRLANCLLLAEPSIARTAISWIWA